MNALKFFVTLSVLFGVLHPVHRAGAADETYIQVRLVETEQSDSLAFMEVIGSEKRFALKRDILFNISLIDSATSEATNPPSPYITLSLHSTPAGKDSLKAISNTYLKKRIGIIVNENLVGAPTIISEIRNGIIGIPIKLPNEFVDKMAKDINQTISKSREE